MSVRVFILVGGIECFIVLVGVEGVVERQKLDNDLRHRLKRSETNVRSLKARLAKVLPGADIDVRTDG